MKMPKEYVLVLIIGLFLLAYLLEAVVDPLTISITSPYQYVTLGHWSRLPFTTAIIAIRSLAVIMSPLWLLSFISGAFQFKALALLIVSVLVQLYGVQGTVSATVGIPLEWAVSFAVGGALLLIPMLFFFAKGAVGSQKSAPPKEIGSLAEDDDDF